MSNKNQQEFDRMYMSSTELCEKVGCNRSTLLHARRQGKTPAPIKAEGIGTFIWKRDEAEVFIKQWKAERKAREDAIIQKEKDALAKAKAQRKKSKKTKAR